MVSSAALVDEIAAWPNASPQPTMPSSVSTLTSRISICVQGFPAKRDGGPPMLNGSATTHDSKDLIRIPPRAPDLTTFLYQRDGEIIAFVRPDLAMSRTGSLSAAQAVDIRAKSAA